MDTKKHSIAGRVLLGVPKSGIRLSILRNLGFFVLAFLLSRAVVYGSCAPFAMSFAAATGLIPGSIFSLSGAIIGYFFAGTDAGSLKYIAATLIIFAAQYLFKDSQISKKHYFPSLVTLLSYASIGVAFLVREAFSNTSFIIFLTELLLSCAAAYFYNIVLTNPKQGKSLKIKRLVGYLILLITVLIPFSRIQVFNISIGRTLAILCVLTASYINGITAGSLTGITAGFAMDMSITGTPFLSAIYGMSGVIGGMFAKTGRFVCALAYVITNGVLIMWSGDSALGTSTLFETFLASLVFMLLSHRVMDDLRGLINAPPEPQPKADNTPQLRNFTKQKLDNLSTAFSSLHKMLGQPGKFNDENVKSVFDRTAQRVCKNCAMCHHCWKQDYQTTLNSLNDASAAILTRGKAQPADFPLHFSSRCVNLEGFISQLNQELHGLRTRKQYQSKLSQSQSLVYSQYREMSNIFSEISSEFEHIPTFDTKSQDKIRRHFKLDDLDASVLVYSDKNKRKHVQISGQNLAVLTENGQQITNQLGELLELNMTGPVVSPGKITGLLFCQAEEFTATVGIAKSKKQGQGVSGDNCECFRTPDGQLYMVLSDGMGTGDSANRESKATVELLKQFLTTGIDADTTLKTLNSAFILRAEQENSFATIDLLRLNLADGSAVSYKCGAANSYVKNGYDVKRITCSSMPAGSGLLDLKLADKQQLTLNRDDIFVMVSDGVCEGSDDWLRNLILQESAPKALAASIVRQAATKNGGQDDVTAVVLKVA